TDDEIRSLAISQRLLGTREIILIHHTDCGMLTFTDDDFKKQIEEEIGIRPPWAPNRSPTRPRTSASRCAVSRPVRSSPCTSRCAGSCSTSPPVGSPKSPWIDVTLSIAAGTTL